MEHSFRIDSILPDLRATMNNQSCFFEERKPKMAAYPDPRPLLTPESPDEEDKKPTESPNQDINCRKRSKTLL